MKKSKYQVVETTMEHVNVLAQNMREPDRAEVWASTHTLPLRAVALSVSVSPYVRTGLAKNKLVCIFGVGALTICSTTGVPWLLATGELERCAKPFLRRSKNAVGQMMNGYQLLRNYADARNEKSLQWLRWLGFEVLPAEPFGVDRLPFHPFEMRA